METMTNRTDRMSPERLKSFLAVARRLSFTRAAEELALTQSAVSRQVRQLEVELSIRLFERIGKSVFLTEAGRTLRPMAESILAQMERAQEAVRGCAGAGAGRLRIGASTTPGFYILPSILGRFCTSHPDVDLQFQVENSQSIEQRVLHNELDLGFVGDELANRALLIEPVAEDEIVCFCGASHALAGVRNPRPSALSRATWIVREHGSATRQLFDRHARSIGLRMNKVIELNSPEAIKALVRAGIGISFMSIHGISEALNRKELRRIPTPGKRLRRRIYLVRHPDKFVSEGMRGFMNLLPGSKGVANRSP